MSPPQQPRGPTYNGLVWGLRTLARAVAQIAAQLTDGARMSDRQRLQTLRHTCRVDGIEQHDFSAMGSLGRVVTVPGIDLGTKGLWHSHGTNYEPARSDESRVKHAWKVKGCGSFLVQRYGRALKRQHTLLAGIGLNPVGMLELCGPGTEAYFGFFEPAEGHCDIVGGHRRVSSLYRDEASVGVLMFPAGGAAGPANHAVCHGDENTLPAVLSSQAPVTVFAGMRRSEMIAALMREYAPQLADMLIDAVVGAVVDATVGLLLRRVPILGTMMSRLLARRILGPVVRAWANKRIRKVIADALGKPIGRWARRALEPHVREAGGVRTGQSTTDGLEESFTRWMEQP